MKPLRLLLLPFSLVYGAGVMIRNLAFDLGLFKTREFDIPVISVGNLSVGGSGKSPMTEYLVRLLKNSYKIATLSRGYGRKSRGFLYVEAGSHSSETGDEPLQFKRKFEDVTVAVCEKRVQGIEKLRGTHNLVILDDAYQHRWVSPGLSILLLEYSGIFNFKMLLPAGDLREPVWEKDRADILVVTKTPPDLNPAARKDIHDALGSRTEQPVFFSYLAYGDLIPLYPEQENRSMLTLRVTTKVLLLTGIANPAPLLSELGGYTQHIDHHRYADHHNFTRKNIVKLVTAYSRPGSEDRIIITTEKDAQRLRSPWIDELLKDLPVYYLPVRAEIHEPEKAEFDELIRKYAAEFTIHH